MKTFTAMAQKTENPTNEHEIVIKLREYYKVYTQVGSV